MVSLDFSVKSSLTKTSTVNLVPQGSRLSQYFQVKILMECSDQVNFLFLKNRSEYFCYEYFAIYHQTLILTVLLFLTVSQVHNNICGLSIGTNIQKFRNSYINSICYTGQLAKRKCQKPNKQSPPSQKIILKPILISRMLS